MGGQGGGEYLKPGNPIKASKVFCILVFTMDKKKSSLQQGPTEDLTW